MMMAGTARLLTLRACAATLAAVGCLACAHAAPPAFRGQGAGILFARPIAQQQFKRDDPRREWTRYLQATLRSASGRVHVLRADGDIAPFDGAVPPEISPSGEFVVLQTLEGDYASDGESSWWHEIAACVFVAVDSGQVVRRGTRGECDGEFTSGSVWRNIDGQGTDLAGAND